MVRFRSQTLAASILLNSCVSPCSDNSRYLLYSNKLQPLIDVISSHLSVMIFFNPCFAAFCDWWAEFQALCDNLCQSGSSAIQPLPNSKLVSSLCALVATVLDSSTKYAVENEVVSFSSNKNKNQQQECKLQLSRPVINDQSKTRITDIIWLVVAIAHLHGL